MPSINARPQGTLFKVLDVPASELHAYPDLAMEICTGRYDVVLIRKVFSEATMNGVLEKLLTDRHGLPVSPQGNRDLTVPQVIVYGHSITPNDVDWRDQAEFQRLYHERAARFGSACRELFSGGEDYESRITQVFSTLCAGRAALVPGDAQGRTFTPSTIRRVMPGAEMNLHVGNYFLSTPAYTHLASLLAPLDQLSFFLPISPPDSGGAIEVFDLKFGDADTPFLPNGELDAKKVERERPFEPFAPGKGDMFLFNGGRFYHRVDFVVGSRPRFTIGGFLSFARDPAITYHWG